MQLQMAFSLDDILLKPDYYDGSRKEVDLSSTLMFSKVLELPIISSPMNTVTEEGMAIAMARGGGLGVVHRYNTIEEQSTIVGKFFATAQGREVAAAVGMSGDYKERAEELIKRGVRFICIDVAHGHHSYMKKAIMNIKMLDSRVKVIAGNVATYDGYKDLAKWGADAVRVGIGGGSICSTRVHTGHGVPNASAIMECNIARKETGVQMIADGGIKNAGDIVKALALGADYVMCGSLLAGTEETPGEVISIDGKLCKAYHGMASKEAQKMWRGAHSSDEGVASYVPYKGSVSDILESLENRMRSGFAYSGARNLKELQTKVRPMIQTILGHGESSTHILQQTMNFKL